MAGRRVFGKRSCGNGYSGDLRFPEIKDILLGIGYTPPHRNSVQKSLKHLRRKHHDQLIEHLKNIQSLSITTDFWTNRALESFLCITGHFLDENFKSESIILSFSSYKHRHVSANIAQSIINRLKELGVYEKLHSITCDGAANMTNACNQISTEIPRLWCIAHRLHLVICNALGFWMKAKKSTDDIIMDILENSDGNGDAEEEDETGIY
ncbi:unnamed protein product [Didymodactylos carnosus]|uniref:Uncharacterized protein n=1 Tax=Didymodactylos carnosus TaxID=1234261 RepID=A0A815XPL3_9BILA|nr:unnamed protein product [Didymodactylos carnosus]CAF4421527.1 unnamed protein product [Didymodactylos carnosus]